MRSRSLLVSGTFVVLFVGLALTTAGAQYRAGIQGTVTDPTGAVVKDATVSVVDQDTGRALTAVSNDSGFYSVLNLAPGTYTVKVEVPGFKESATKDIEIAAETVKGVNVALQTGATSEQVVVNGEAAPALQTEDGNITGTISNVQLQTLPSFRGDPYELLRLTPGVFGTGARSADGSSANLPNYAGTGGSVFGIFQTENTVQVSNGQRVDANGYSLDGVSTNSQRHGGATVLTPNEESVKEVKVEVNAYNAENGHNAGAVTEAVSQTGTNNLHGSAVFRIHSPGLNAYQRWNGINSSSQPNAVQRDNQRIHEYLGSIGGPIWKNKVFAFFSFDHMKTGGTNTSESWVETPEFISSLPSGSVAQQLFAVKGSGFFSPVPEPAKNLCANVGLVNDGVNCAEVAGGAGLDIGSPTGGPGTIVNTPTGGGLDGIPDIQFLQYAGKPDTINATQFNGRLDVQATSKDLVAFSVYKSPFLKSFLPGGWVDGRQYDVFNSDAQHDVATVLWNRTLSSTMVNEARFNVTHWFFDELKGNPQAPWGLPTDNITIPQNTIGVGFFSGPGIFHEATYTFRDTLSKVKNSHVMKFGFDFEREQNNDTNAWAAHPNYNFDNLWSFANDAPSSQGTGTFDPKTGQITAFKKYVRVSNYAVFGQDTWKARSNLSLTLGLRWEYTTPLHDKNNSLSGVVLGQGVNSLTDLKIVQGGNLFQPDRNNFGPQLGFAWSPGRSNNKLVWRGGIGVAFSKIGEERILQADGNPPSFLPTGLNAAQLIYGVSSKGPYSFTGFAPNPNTIEQFDANGLPIPSSNPNFVKPDIRGPVQGIRTPYTIHYSLEMQYDIGHQWTGSLSFQGAQARKMQRTVNYSLLYPNNLNPVVNSIFLTQSDTNSSYNALVAHVNHSFASGIEVGANYRWSKSLDFCSYDENCGDQQSFPINQKFERGPSDFDVTHTFTSNVIYELPFFKGRHDLLYTMAGGWKIGAIISLNSGFPWTPLFSYDGATCSALQLSGISCTSRPGAYLGGAGEDYSTETFKKLNGNFPNGSLAYFTAPASSTGLNVPGIGRNSFRGPRYTGIDMSFGKRFTIPKVPLLGENAGLEIKANAFNVFNKVNANPFLFNTDSTRIGNADPLGGVPATANSNFGRSSGALAGRVIEMQARFSF